MSKPKIELVDASATPNEINDVLKRDGCLIIPELVGHERIDALMADLQPYLDKRPTCAEDFLGTHTKRMQVLIPKSQHVRELLAHDKILSVLDLVLGPYCDNYTLSSNSMTVIGPGETPQSMHRDDVVFPFSHPQRTSLPLHRILGIERLHRGKWRHPDSAG